MSSRIGRGAACRGCRGSEGEVMGSEGPHSFQLNGFRKAPHPGGEGRELPRSHPTGLFSRVLRVDNCRV